MDVRFAGTSCLLQAATIGGGEKADISRAPHGFNYFHQWPRSLGTLINFFASHFIWPINADDRTRYRRPNSNLTRLGLVPTTVTNRSRTGRRHCTCPRFPRGPMEWQLTRSFIDRPVGTVSGYRLPERNPPPDHSCMVFFHLDSAFLCFREVNFKAQDKAADFLCRLYILFTLAELR